MADLSCRHEVWDAVVRYKGPVGQALEEAARLHPNEPVATVPAAQCRYCGAVTEDFEGTRPVWGGWTSEGSTWYYSDQTRPTLPEQ